MGRKFRGMDVVVSELQRLPTSGARAVEPVVVDGLELLAVPQLAVDIPGQAPSMHAGDSDTDLLLFRRDEERYVPFATLPAPGGEDAECFTIGERVFLAVASLRSGAGPYRFATDSTIYEWRAGAFHPFQTIPTVAAKQFKHWRIGERDFLGLAQGVVVDGVERQESVVFEWDGERFAAFQRIPSRWAYNWHPFQIGETYFVAHAEHLGPSVLYRWDGERLVPHQELIARAGRAFATFESHLLVAGLTEPPRLLRFNGTHFESIQELEGLGARELTVVERGARRFVIRVNFILGTPKDPHPVMTSQVYEFVHGRLEPVAEFGTVGGTDVALIGEDRFVVSNSLSPELRFASETVVYSLEA
jgi:hypothetical protein